MPQVKGYRNNLGNLTWENTNDAPILRRSGAATGGPPKQARVRSWTSFVRSAAIIANMPYGCCVVSASHGLRRSASPARCHAMPDRNWSRRYAPSGWPRISCAASDSRPPCRCGCRTMGGRSRRTAGPCSTPFRRPLSTGCSNPSVPRWRLKGCLAPSRGPY